MVYKYAPDENHEDLAAGRVLYHRGGMPSFPVRPGNEIFRRCLEYSGKKSGIRLYDPCCGGAYLLTVLGFLNGSVIGDIVGSDIDEQAIVLAKDNLSLLSKEGRLTRRKQLEDLSDRYHKSAHREALLSLGRLGKLSEQSSISPKVELLQADILNPGAVFAGLTWKADIIIADVPYGKMTAWVGKDDADHSESNLDRLFQNLSPIRNETTITALISDKTQKLKISSVYRLDKFNIGKRKVEIVRG